MIRESWQTGVLGPGGKKPSWRERLLLGEKEGAWCEACPVVGSGNLERGKRRLQVPGVTSMAGGGQGGKGHTLLLPPSSQSGPHPHLQCRTVSIRTL